MADLRGFDANEHDTPDFSPLPDGDYLAVITASELKRTKAGDGQYLALTFEIIDGPHKGRRVWARLNTQNKNATAQEIAKQQLAAICKAVGVLRPQDSQQLHNIPMIIGVKVRENSTSGRLENDIKTYRPRGESATTTSVVKSREVPENAVREQVREAPRDQRDSAPWSRK